MTFLDGTQISGELNSIEDGVVKSMEVPTNTFYCHDSANVALFVGPTGHVLGIDLDPAALARAERVELQTAAAALKVSPDQVAKRVAELVGKKKAEGLTVGTFLTMLLFPVFYATVFRLKAQKAE